jgi:hypothetical protein
MSKQAFVTLKSIYNQSSLRNELSLLSRESRANLTPLDVGKSRGRRRLNLEDVLWVAVSGRAWPGITAVKPLHEAALVPPNTHRQDHTTAHCIAHTLHGAQLHEHIRAVGLAGRVVQSNALGLIDKYNAILHVLAVDRLQHAVLSGELSNDGEGLLGVDLEPLTVEVLGPVAVRVLAAAGLVTKACLAALVALAGEKGGLAAGVGCDRGGAGVGLPDVHLVAADAGAVEVGL